MSSREKHRRLKKKTNSRTPHIDIITVSFKPQEMKTKVNEKTSGKNGESLIRK